MKNPTFRDLFRGYEDLTVPREIDEEMSVNVSVSPSRVTEDDILFITEKVGRERQLFDTDSLNSAPYAIVASRDTVLSSDDIPVIRVGNVRSALSYALSNLYKIDYDKIKFIGVTGTNGKTTTATLIYEILKACDYKVGFIGTGKIISDSTVLSDANYSMTTPDPTTLYPAISRMSHDGCQYIVMEVSSHAIALGKISPIRFEYAIFTNLDNDHLDFHKDKEEYFQAKLSLFNMTKRGLFNLDDNYVRRAYRLAECEKSSFGILNPGDAYATEIDMRLDKTTFYYREKDLISKTSTGLIGAFNVYNSLAALRCVIDLGIKPCIAKRALEGIDSIDGRMELIDDIITVVIDYAHTPSAFYNCIKTLKRNFIRGQKLTIVFGCGGDRDPGKRPVFGHYAEMYADKIIITEDNSRTEDFDRIVDDILCGMTIHKHEVINDRELAIRRAILTSKPGDLVAIIGKGHEKYKIVGNEYVPFDEREIVSRALLELRSNYADNT